MVNSTSQMAFAVAFCALAAAGIGSIVNLWLTGWFAVGGMVGVGLFYWAVGVINLPVNSPVFDDDESMLNTSRRTARMDNLFAEAVTRSGAGYANASESPELLHCENQGPIAENHGMSEGPQQLS